MRSGAERGVLGRGGERGRAQRLRGAESHRRSSRASRLHLAAGTVARGGGAGSESYRFLMSVPAVVAGVAGSERAANNRVGGCPPALVLCHDAGGGEAVIYSHAGFRK